MTEYTQNERTSHQLVAAVLNSMIVYNEGDVRRINHSLKVYGFAKSIAGMEKLSDRMVLIVELSAALHDIGIKESERKYNSSAGSYQELEGPPVATAILEGLGVDRGISDRVCFIVGNHHSYSNIDNIDFQILVEADFLVNIFEENTGTDAISSIRQKYFKTKAGIGMLDSIYRL
jgi:hypothetical protein